MSGPASEAVRADLGAPLPERAPAGSGGYGGEGRGVAGTEAQRPGTSVPRRSPQRQAGSRLPALPAEGREEGGVSRAREPPRTRVRGHPDPQPGLAPHGAVPASTANVLKRGAVFWVPSTLYPKGYLITYLNGTRPNERAPVQQRSEAGLNSMTRALARVWMAPA